MAKQEHVGDGARADVDRASVLSVLTTEHFTLQSARASTIGEGSARAYLYVGAVSSALIALGFIGQASEFGAEFDAFALVGGTTIALAASQFAAPPVVVVLVGASALAVSLAGHRTMQTRIHVSTRESTTAWFPSPAQQEPAAGTQESGRDLAKAPNDASA